MYRNTEKNDCVKNCENDDCFIIKAIETVLKELELKDKVIEEIEELKYDVVDENGRGWYKLDTIADKVTELVKAVNKMKEGKE